MKCDTCRADANPNDLQTHGVVEDGLSYSLTVHRDYEDCEANMVPTITIDDLNTKSRAALSSFEVPPPYTFDKARSLGLID